MENINRLCWMILWLAYFTAGQLAVSYALADNVTPFFDCEAFGRSVVCTAYNTGDYNYMWVVTTGKNPSYFANGYKSDSKLRFRAYKTITTIELRFPKESGIQPIFKYAKWMKSPEKCKERRVVFVLTRDEIAKAERRCD